MTKKSCINWNKVGRNFLRVGAILTLSAYIVFRIIIPLAKQDKVYLDINDGYLMLGCVAVLLAIEAVKALIERKLNNR